MRRGSQADGDGAHHRRHRRLQRQPDVPRLHAAWFLIWIGLNTIPGLLAFDPFPFGLLTMCVSLEAIFLSVIVLLSQNRQSAKDRIRADIEYDVNLKAELEVSHLHEKVDQLQAALLSRLHQIDVATRR